VFLHDGFEKARPMTKIDRTARGKLVEYAKKFLKVTARPDEPICVTPEQVAAFAAQVREGCQQDIVRLCRNLAKDNLHGTGQEALLSFADTVVNGETIELWGLPDCACGKPACVYCGRGFAIPPTIATGTTRVEDGQVIDLGNDGPPPVTFPNECGYCGEPCEGEYCSEEHAEHRSME